MPKAKAQLHSIQNLKPLAALFLLHSLHGPEVINHYSSSTQLSMKFILLINVKMSI